MPKPNDIKQGNCLYKTFSARRVQIDELRLLNQEFVDLCDDYEECMSILEGLRKQSTPNLEQVKEYTELRESLEAEINYYLNRTDRVT